MFVVAQQAMTVLCTLFCVVCGFVVLAFDRMEDQAC